MKVLPFSKETHSARKFTFSHTNIFYIHLSVYNSRVSISKSNNYGDYFKSCLTFNVSIFRLEIIHIRTLNCDSMLHSCRSREPGTLFDPYCTIVYAAERNRKFASGGAERFRQIFHDEYVGDFPSQVAGGSFSSSCRIFPFRFLFSSVSPPLFFSCSSLL